MSDKSSIEWTDATWNVLTGCTRVSEGCRNCYAERLAATRLAHMPAYEGVAAMTPEGPRWTGVVRFNVERLDQPLRWRRPRMVFVNSQSDVFHEAVTNEQIAAIFGIMGGCPGHTFQVLTKRPERAAAWFKWLDDAAEASLATFPEDNLAWRRARILIGSVIHLTGGSLAAGGGLTWPLPNVWLGVSAEDQATADERIPLLLACPAAVRWVSAEPLLGPIDVRRWITGGRSMHMSANVEGALRNRSFRGLLSYDGRELSEVEAEVQLRELQQRGVRLIASNGCDNFDPERGCCGHASPRLDWIVCGGESGPGARPMHPDWARALIAQCTAAGVPAFFKQWGAWEDRGRHTAARGDVFLWPDGDRHVVHGGEFPADTNGAWTTMRNVGKRAAGRLLDGRTWDEMPAVKAVPA